MIGCQKNYMMLNVDKTEYIVIGKPNLLKKLGDLSIKFSDVVIKRVSKIKSLGLTIDENLSWVDHTNIIIRKCNFSIRSLYQIQHLISEPNKKLIINAYILPVIKYMCPVWGTCSTEIIKKIDRIITKAGKFVLNIKYSSNIKNIVSENLKWFYTKYLYQFEVLKIAFNFLALDLNSDVYFKNYINPQNFQISRKTRNFTYIRSNNIKRSFLHNATQLWINLPDELSSIINVNTFKTELSNHLLMLQNNEFDLQIKNNHYCNLSCIDSVVNNLITNPN